MTICDAYRYGSTLSEGGPCLGWRNTPLVPFLWLTYNETMLRAKNFGSGLLTLGLSPGENTRLGILARSNQMHETFQIISTSIPSLPRTYLFKQNDIPHDLHNLGTAQSGSSQSWACSCGAWCLCRCTPSSAPPPSPTSLPRSRPPR